MIEISALSAPKAAVPGRPAPVAESAPEGFARVFTCEMPVVSEESLAALAAGRQVVAEGGKDLPVLAVEGEAAGDEAKGPEGDDIAFAWFQLPVIAPDQAAPVQAAAVQTAATPAIAVTADGAAIAPPAAPTLPAVDGSAPILLPADFVVTPEKPLPAEQAALIVAALGGKPAAKPAAPVAATPAHAEAKAAAPATTPVEAVLRDLVAQADTSRTTQPQRVAVPLVAVPQRFEAIQPLVTALVADIAPVSQRPSARDLATPALSPLAAAELQQAPRQVTAMTDTQQGNLDMSRQEWMGAMIETIEALRETPNSREANIRLSPDALGTVDIAISQEGDRIHVRFTADTPAARAMLSEAQPRLAELAEAKGVRLGQTTVDGGATGQGSQRNESAQRPQMHSTPASARSAAEAQTDTDQRIA